MELNIFLNSSTFSQEVCLFWRCTMIWQHIFPPLICFTKSYISNIKERKKALFVNCSVTCCKGCADIASHRRNLWEPETVQWKAPSYLIFCAGSGFKYYCNVSTVSQNRQTKVQYVSHTQNTLTPTHIDTQILTGDWTIDQTDTRPLS